MGPIDFESIILSHYSRYPKMQVQDLYKLVHQAAMGSEHAVKDIESARQWLLREIEHLPSTSAEPLIDAISPDQNIIRVHLKPYTETGLEPEKLLLAFIQTANEFTGSTNLLRVYWKDIQYLTNKGEIPFSPEDLKYFIGRLEEQGFPAIHHSEIYIAAYSPSYRVIANRYLEIGNPNLDSQTK